MDQKSIVAEDTLKSFLDAFNRHDLVDIMSFFTNEPVLDMPRGPQPWGRVLRARRKCGPYLEGALKDP